MSAIVKLTTNFERNLESLEQFLSEAEAPHAFDALLDALTDTVIPNLERFPQIGSSFLNVKCGSVETLNSSEALAKIAGNLDIRQYVFGSHLVLYATSTDTVYLLAIKHHRQLSFDLDAIWLANKHIT